MHYDRDVPLYGVDKDKGVPPENTSNIIATRIYHACKNNNGAVHNDNNDDYVGRQGLHPVYGR